MSFPKECKELPFWICWRFESDKDGKMKKIPIDPKTGKPAKSNDSSTWSDYQTAVDAAAKYGCTGIGFVFAENCGFVGIDVDHCYDMKTGNFNETAAAILNRQKTYAEFSPSGTGIHVWFKGTKPSAASRNAETGVEMYDHGRYFTVTENALEGASENIETALPDTLTWIQDTFIARKKDDSNTEKPANTDRLHTDDDTKEPIDLIKNDKSTGRKTRKAAKKLTDDEILEKARTSKISEAFTKLWNGDWKEQYESQSEADLSLCRILAFWTGRDIEQMDRLFRQSGLMRNKWDDKHYADGTTYGKETLQKAIDSTNNTYFAGNGTDIMEIGGRYCRVKNGDIMPLTNFIIVPIEMITSDTEAQMTADFVNDKGGIFRITCMTSDFSNLQKFRNILNAHTISLSFYGGESDLEHLKDYISGYPWVKKTGVKAMGICIHEGRPIFVSSEGIIAAKGAVVDNTIQIEKYISIRSGILNAEILSGEQLKEIGKYILTYNEPQKTISILAWITGCFLKEYLRTQGVKFPHLFLIGEAGSGKSTTLERVILPVFSADKVTVSTQVTPFTLMKEAASSSLIPFALDEFKPSKIDKLKLNALYNHFRDAYDGHEGRRGRADQTVVTYDFLAPMVIAGEESAEETAIRERSIELLFSKKDIKVSEYRTAFDWIVNHSGILQRLGKTLLRVTLSASPDTVLEWYTTGKALFSRDLPSRVISNLSCMYARLKLVETMCAGYHLAWSEIFPYSIDICVKYLEAAAKDYLLDGSTHNPSIIETTLEIMYRMDLSPRYDYTFSDDRTLIYICLCAIYDEYTKYCKDHAITGEILTYSQFRKQLRHSDLCVQENVQKRFNGNNSKCWVLDFAKLETRVDVSGFLE